MIPSILNGVHILWTMFVIIPCIAISMLFNPPEKGIMKQIAGTLSETFPLICSMLFSCFLFSFSCELCINFYGVFREKSPREEEISCPAHRYGRCANSSFNFSLSSDFRFVCFFAISLYSEYCD